MDLRPNNTNSAGDGSHNNQATTINNHYHGASMEQVERIINNKLESKLSDLHHSAFAVALERQNDLNSKILERLKVEDQSILNVFSKPSMQDTLFNTQKAYAVNDDAVTDDEDLADMLVEILIERAKVSNKNRQRIVLDESLKIAPKLTIDQMDLLSYIHFRYRVKHLNSGNLETLIERLKSPYSLINLIDEGQINDDLNFMEILGLGKITVGSYPSLGNHMRSNYPAYFMKGFTLDELNASEINDNQTLISCFHDANKIQFGFETKDLLTKNLRENGFVEERITHIVPFFDQYLMSSVEIESFLLTRFPEVQKINEVHSSTNIDSFELSGIGMAIALSNYQRRFGEKNDLSIWVK